MVYQNHKSRSFRDVPQGSVLGPVLFSLFINDLPASLPSSVSCSFYADDLAIWSSSPSVPIVVEATQGALFRLTSWSEYWCLPLNPSKCEASFFSVDPHQANLQPNLLLLSFDPTPIFLGVTFDRTLSFSKVLSTSQSLTLYLCFLMEPFYGVPFLSVQSFSSAPSHLCFTRMVSFLKRCQYHQIGMPPPSGQSGHHRLPLVLPYPSSSLRGFFTSPTSHPDSFHSFIL